VSAGVRRVVFCVKLSVRYQLLAYLSCIARITASPLVGAGALDHAIKPPADAITAAASARRDPMTEDNFIRAPA
jgi:hypothetical protein